MTRHPRPPRRRLATSRTSRSASSRRRDARGVFFFADDYLVQVADVTLTTPLFKHSPAATTVGDKNGITVNKLRVVTVEAAIDQRRITSSSR